MKHILTCSFGKDSIATALLALQHGEPLDELVYSEVMFSDTVSGELPEHKRFIYETAIPYFEKRGIPTRVLRGQKTYLDCFYHIVSRGNAEGKLASFPLTGRCSIQRDCKLPPIERIYICRMSQISGQERHLISFFRRLMRYKVNVIATEYALNLKVPAYHMGTIIDEICARKGWERPWFVSESSERHCVSNAVASTSK